MPSRPTRVLAIDPVHPSDDVVQEAARVLRAGGLVAFPTETVYGLGANALDARAVRRIFEAKGRPSTDPLIVHITGPDDLPALVREVPPVVPQLARRFWPGALTIILPKQASVPDEVTAGLDTVALRVPSHPVARALIAAAACPIAAPSANRFSRPSPTDAAHVLLDLDGRLDMVLDGGRTEIGLESTVLDLSVTPPLVRRPGGVTVEALRTELPELEVMSRFTDAGDAQISPGQLLRHYAPRARMTLIDGEPDAVRTSVVRRSEEAVAAGKRMGILAPAEDAGTLEGALRQELDAGRVVIARYGSRAEPGRSARELFDAIRTLDGSSPDEILAIGLPTEGIGLAIHDRLTRAAEGRVVRV